jgi:hypothetical protein
MIVGFNFTSIKGYTKDPSTGNLTINSAPKIVDVEEAKIAGVSEVLKIKFGFVCEYSPDAAKVELEGNLLWKDESAKEIMKQWKEDKKVNVKIAAPILNAIFRRCLTKTVGLADELRLPPPVQFPIVVEGKASKAKEQKTAA